jgi:deazaflavin-dependent oxidoreductase (nitroreductase family)
VKRRVVRVVQKFLLNPPVKLLLALGVPRPGYSLLETIGRNSGKPRRTPVGDGLVGRQFWIVAEHGRDSNYVRNIDRNPRVRVKIRSGLQLRWHSGTATILDDDDPIARQQWLAKQRRGAASNARVVRLLGTNLLTVRIDLDTPAA